MTILDLHAKVDKIFKNPNINFFIIMNLILIISCYSFIDDPIRKSITYVISNPFITLIILILVIVIGYFNINIAMLVLLLFFVALYAIPTKKNKLHTNFKNHIEGFTSKTNTNNDDNDNNDNNDDNNDEDSLNSKSVKNFEERNRIIKERAEIARETIKQKKEEARKEYNKSSKGLIEKKIDSFKDIISNNIDKIKTTGENQYKQGLLENKQKILDYEMQNSKSNIKSNKSNKSTANNSKNKEDFQTIQLY
jgi:Ca2+/Na+ antiporter